MNIKNIILPIVTTALLSMQPVAQAADTTLAIEQMAEIMLNMEARPNLNAIQTLEDIAKDSASTTNERLLASSIKNMDKKVSPDDKPSLMKIWLSPSASEHERNMAKILLRFEETPSESAKETLTTLVEQ